MEGWLWKLANRLALQRSRGESLHVLFEAFDGAWNELAPDVGIERR